MLRRGLFVALLLAGCAGTPLRAETRQEWSQPTKKWIRGPVRCLVTSEEEKQFKALVTDEERAKFIQEFWAKRDPTPGTPENEFAELFWKRVAEADQRFVQTTESGAMSDRGQVFLLFGMPTRIAPPGKNVEWIYENIPHMQPSSFHVLFRVVGAGNFLLLGRKEVEEQVAKNEFVRGLGAVAREVYKPPPVEVAAALPSAPASPPPAAAEATEEQRILEAVTDPLPAEVPLRVRPDVYEATGGDAFVALTVGIPRSGAPAGTLVAFARFTPEGEGAPPVHLTAPDSFAPAVPENSDPSASHLLFQGGTGLHPGHYTLLAGVRDPASGKMGIVRQSLEIPSYEGGTLKLSSFTLSRKLERLSSPPPASEGKKAPFVIGSFRVVPSLEPVYRQGADLSWYFQIYNVASEPATGKPNLTIQYDILLKQKGEYRPVTEPLVFRNRQSQVEAFSFPLVRPTEKQKGYVAGDYKLIVKVTDEVAKATATQEVPFTVVP